MSSSHNHEDVPHLWPSMKLLTENAELTHYDVFISFSGRGTMKGIANAIQETIRSSYDNSRTTTLPSVFNEDIDFQIEETVARALHATHAGLAVLLINQRYVTRRWPLAEASILVAMWLSKRITLLPVLVVSTNSHNNKVKDATSLWKDFVQAMHLKPSNARRLEELKYRTLVAPFSNVDFEDEPIPISKLRLPFPAEYEEVKQVLIDMISKRPDAILGPSRRDAFLHVLNRISEANDVMGQPMLSKQLDLDDTVHAHRKDMLVAAHREGSVAETKIDKLEAICKGNRFLRSLVKEYKMKFLDLTLESPRGRFLDDYNDSSGGLSVSTTMSTPERRATGGSNASLQARFAGQRDEKIHGFRPTTPSVASSPGLSARASAENSLSPGSFSLLNQSAWSSSSEKLVPVDDVRFNSSMTSSSSLSPTSSLSTYSSPSTRNGFYEMLNNEDRVDRPAVVQRVKTMIEKFRMCYVYGRSGAGKSVVVDSVIQAMNPNRRPWIVEFGDLPIEYGWQDFAKSFSSTWDQEAQKDGIKIPRLSTNALPHVDAFCTFIDDNLDMIILDNVQRVESSVLVKDLRTILREKREKKGCILLLISQNPPDGAFPKETEGLVNIEGLGKQDVLSLFRMLRGKAPFPDEERCLERARKSVGGHVSLLRHIISQDGFLHRLAKDPAYSRQLPTISLDLLYESMYSSKVSSNDIRVFLMHVAFIRLRFPMRFFRSLASHLQITDYVVEVLQKWSWMNVINRNSEGDILRYDDQLVYMNDFERETLVGRLSGSNAKYHHTLARVLSDHFDPSEIFPFDTLTPSDMPFFPDSVRDTAERLLQTGFVDRLPGVTQFFALRELTYHILSSCIGNPERREEEVLKSAIEASHYFLLLDWLLYQYGHRVESRKMSEYLEEALRGRPHLLHAQVWLRPIRVLVDQGEVDAAQKKLKNEVARRYPKKELPPPTLVLAIQLQLEARILTLRARHDEAFTQHLSSIRIFRDAENPKGESTAFILSARSAHELDKLSAPYEAAPVLALEAARLCQTQNFTNPRFAWENLLSASEMYWELGKDREAARCILQCLHHMDLYLGRQAGIETELKENTIAAARKIFAERQGSLIFDCDGVLVDTEKIKFKAWQSVARKRNANLNYRTYYLKLAGLHIDEVVKWLQDDATKRTGGYPNAWKDVAAVKAEFTVKLKELYEIEKDDKQDLLRLSREHVVNAFIRARLAKNSWWPSLHLAVVSLENKEMLFDNLKLVGIEKGADIEICCGADPYSQLASHWPGPYLVVEDSTVGAIKARESGMEVVLLSGTPLVDRIPHLQHYKLHYENGAGPYAFLAYLAGVVDRDEALVEFPIVSLSREERETIDEILRGSDKS